jgi:hypothetical protein
MNRLHFFFKAQTAHGLHSPSIYALYVELLNPYLKGELSYLELNEALSFRYPAYSIYEVQENFNPAKIDENTLLLLRNPHEKEDFWNALKSHPKVIQTVDLFKLGLVFFKPICPKQNFYLRKQKNK